MTFTPIATNRVLGLVFQRHEQRPILARPETEADRDSLGVVLAEAAVKLIAAGELWEFDDDLPIGGKIHRLDLRPRLGLEVRVRREPRRDDDRFAWCVVGGAVSAAEDEQDKEGGATHQ